MSSAVPRARWKFQSDCHLGGSSPTNISRSRMTIPPQPRCRVGPVTIETMPTTEANFQNLKGSHSLAQWPLIMLVSGIAWYNTVANRSLVCWVTPISCDETAHFRAILLEAVRSYPSPEHNLRAKIPSWKWAANSNTGFIISIPRTLVFGANKLAAIQPYDGNLGLAIGRWAS